MERINVTAWKVVMALPGVNIIAGIVMWFSVYDLHKRLIPDTTRSLGKDILLSVISFGLYGLVIPYQLMKETQEGAARVGIRVTDNIGAYYGSYFGMIVLSFVLPMALVGMSGDSEDGLLLSGLVQLAVPSIMGVLQAHFFLKPFDEVAEQFNAIES